MPSREKRFVQKVSATVAKLNRLMLEAKRMGLEVEHQVDVKQLGFPVFVVSLLRRLDMSKN